MGSSLTRNKKAWIKNILVSILLASLLLSVTACGNSSTSPQASTPEKAADASTPEKSDSASVSTNKDKSPQNYKANIVFQTWTVEAKETIEQQIADFNKTYPNIKVNLEILSYNDYWQKMPIAIAGGSGPDIYIMTRPNFETFARANQVADISTEFNNSQKLQANAAKINPVLIDTYKYKGKQMGLPMSVESTAIVFNKNLFKEANLKLPSEVEGSWTWDDLRDYAVKLTKREGDKITQYGYYVPANRMPTLEYLWANNTELFVDDGKKCTFADENGITAIKFLSDLMLKDKVSPTIAFTQSQTGDDLFISGKIAMMSAGSWTMSKYAKITDFEWDVAEMPKSPKTGKRFASSNVLGYIVGPNTKFKNECIFFLEHVTSADAQRIYGEKKVYIPAHKDVQETYFKIDKPQNILAFKRALEYAKPMAFSEFVPYQQFLSVTNNALTNIYNGKETAEQAWKAAEKEINDIIAENMAK